MTLNIMMSYTSLLRLASQKIPQQLKCPATKPVVHYRISLPICPSMFFIRDQRAMTSSAPNWRHSRYQQKIPFVP